MSTTQAGVDLETEADAYEFLEQLRWGSDGPTTCPHCGSDKGAWFLTPRDPEGRKSKGGTDSKSSRRVWKCKENRCRRQFSVLTNTTLHATKMPVRAWVGVLFELAEAEHGMSAREISKRWGVAEKSAWRMLERIRDAMDPAQNESLSALDEPPRLTEIDREIIDLTAPTSADASTAEPSRAVSPRLTVARSEADFEVAARPDATLAAGHAGSGSERAESESPTAGEVSDDGSGGRVPDAVIERRTRARKAATTAPDAVRSRSDEQVVQGSSRRRERTKEAKRKRPRSERGATAAAGSKPGARADGSERVEPPHATQPTAAQPELLALNWLDEPSTEKPSAVDADAGSPQSRKKRKPRPAAEPAELALGPSWMSAGESDGTHPASQSTKPERGRRRVKK